VPLSSSLPPAVGRAGHIRTTGCLRPVVRLRLP